MARSCEDEVLAPLLRRFRRWGLVRREDEEGAIDFEHVLLGSWTKSQLRISAIPSSTYTIETRMSNVLRAIEVVKKAKMASGMETRTSIGGPSRYRGLNIMSYRIAEKCNSRPVILVRESEW